MTEHSCVRIIRIEVLDFEICRQPDVVISKIRVDLVKFIANRTGAMAVVAGCAACVLWGTATVTTIDESIQPLIIAAMK